MVYLLGGKLIFGGTVRGVFHGGKYCQWVNLGGNLYLWQSNQGGLLIFGNYEWRKFYREGIDMGSNCIGGTFFGR